MSDPREVFNIDGELFHIVRDRDEYRSKSEAGWELVAEGEGMWVMVEPPRSDFAVACDEMREALADTLTPLVILLTRIVVCVAGVWSALCGRLSLAKR